MSVLANDDQILSRGDRAPFTGVLVDEPRYRFYQTRDYEADLCNKKLQNDCFDRGSTDVNNVYLGALISFVGGVLVGVLVEQELD
jgi:hypothetical protein